MKWTGGQEQKTMPGKGFQKQGIGTVLYYKKEKKNKIMRKIDEK
jgi:hypothetical protein